MMERIDILIMALFVCLGFLASLLMLSCDSTKGEMMDNIIESVTPTVEYKEVVKVNEEFKIKVNAPSGYTEHFTFHFDVQPDDLGVAVGRLVPDCDHYYRKAGFYHGLVYCWDKYRENKKQVYFHVQVVE